MSGTASAGDDWIVVGKALPRIETAEPLDKRRICLVWRGTTEPMVVDVSPALTNRRLFRRIRDDDAFFRQLRVNEDGNALEWPDGAELSAVWIEELADASLANEEFRDAMETLDMSLDGMAARLGVSRRLIADYRKDKPIPKTVALATRYLLEQRKAG